jgi:chromosome segregation ATPase
MMQLELTAARRHTESSGPGNGSSRSSGPNNAELAKRLAEAGSRSEAKIAELNSRLKLSETERAEQEERWAKTLASRGEEIERLRNLISLQEKEGRVAGDYKAKRDKDVETLEGKIRQLEADKLEEKRKGRELAIELEMLNDKLENKCFEVADLQTRIEGLNVTLDELKGKESQLKVSNKVMCSKAYGLSSLIEIHLSAYSRR